MLNYNSQTRELKVEGKPGDILKELICLSDNSMKLLSKESGIPYNELKKVLIENLKKLKGK